MTSKVYSVSPVEGAGRFVILDILRGFALLGIIMANFPEFGLYTFLPSVVTNNMPSAKADLFTRWIIEIFIDGKFYTIFSLLFGIGFSIIITNASSKGINPFKFFYRRMGVLFIIGICHLIFLWSGDILMLYALVGMTLPFFIRVKDKSLLIIAMCMLFLPVVIDSICDLFQFSPSAWIVGWQQYYCDQYGITDANFGYWLHDAQTYGDIFKFLIQGSIERMQEFVDGNRYFKVMGLFLIGYYIGRNRLYSNLSLQNIYLKRIAWWGVCLGLPLSILYAWSSIYAHPLGLGIHSMIYFISVYLTSFGYISIICLIFLKSKESKKWNILASPGRMALTNYIGQSITGILIFYGVGIGIGSDTGLIYIEIIALGVFIIEIYFSNIWLKYFRFGPLEWLWRCLTYNRVFSFRK